MFWTQLTKFSLAATLMIASATSAFAAPAEDQFAVAAAHYGQSRWLLAVEEFRSFLDRFSNHSLTPRAEFYQGEALIQLRRYEEAGDKFLAYLNAQPNGEFSVDAQFRLGEANYLRQNHEDARQQLERFREKHPHAKNIWSIWTFAG